MTKDDIIKMAYAAKMHHQEYEYSDHDLAVLERFAELVAEHEREACAKVIESDANACGKTDTALVLHKAASRIRSRGEK
jgi:hypothetical protein